MKKHYRSDQNCLNCGTTVTSKFCPECGQENLELHENFWHLALHSVGHYFHFESKFFNSFVPLFTKPGHLTKEYFAGKRASHLNPISMYIFISIVFFTLFSINSSINKKDIIKDNEKGIARNSNALKAAPAEDKAQAKQAIAEVRKAISDEVAAGTMPQQAAAHTYTILNNTEAAQSTSQDTNQRANQHAVVTTKPVVKASSDAVVVYQKEPELRAEEEQDNEAMQSLQTKFRTVMDDDLSSELFKNKMMSHLPKVMFILLPLFALILMLVHRRSSKYYIEHLVYSIHVHSFIFLFVSILMVISWIVPSLSDWIQAFGVVVVVWYIYMSLRNTYKNSPWRTIYKFFLLSFAYSFLLTISGLLVVLATLYTL
ncbi:DUF3667 domain-containing protein [Rhabdobacter roseus]|uniref:DUF3667 domain-containing protein n=1 Tax=Rhabdobacter roseus TaxID=1655419 RepID=A0A840U048_9BACT|nr:DUF3667 domain-containing protein [Rhabdobacter roseus]MBB5287272.1 hypothetical protein [Rhabdobacter roseus]